VSGLSPSITYASGLFGLNGSLHDARSTWTGNISYSRSATLQTESQATSTQLGLAYTNAANVNGTYSYVLTERWTVGATASAYDNRYDAVADNASFSNNKGYYAGGNLKYSASEVTEVVATAGYSHYSSDPSRSDSVTAVAGIVHRFSPQLTLSGSAGGFWTDTTAAQGALAGESRRATGGLYGGQLSYDFAEYSNIVVSLSENLTPNGAGALSRSDTAGVSLTSRFSDRLTGRLGAGYTRTTFPQAQSGSFNYNYYQGEAGLSYQLAERWTIDAGYHYARARYSNAPGAASNIAFVSIGYNWPGASFTGWVGRPAEMQTIPGAGPLSLPEAPRGTSPARSAPETSPFDPFTIP